MTKKLLVVAASGLVLAILLLSAAWIVGGPAMVTAIHHGGWHFSDPDDDKGPMVTHTLTFDPDQPLTVDAPVELHFVRGDHAEMTVSGSAPLVSALRWQNNRLSISEVPIFGSHSLKVEIVAPHMPPLSVAGAGDVTLEKLDQDDLRIDIGGGANIEANGKVRTVTVTNRGVGNVDLEQLDATDATATVSGVGNIDLNASGKVTAKVSGAGNISLHRKPAELTSQISGIGSVDQDD